MIPRLTGIDHVHLYVGDRSAAERWYREVLGFTRVKELESWATPTGPLTLQDSSGRVHLALFERKQPSGNSTLALGTDGAGFLDWKSHLEACGLKLRIANHELAYSLYFTDPWDNYHEITTMEHGYVAERIAAIA